MPLAKQRPLGFCFQKTGTMNRTNTIQCSQVFYLNQSNNGVEGTRQTRPVTSGERQQRAKKKKAATVS